MTKTVVSGIDVLCVGYCAVDHLLVVPRYPEPDTKSPASDYAVDGGGPAATAAYTSAKLGCRTAFIGVVGDDANGDFILQRLREVGVDVSGVVVDPGAESAVSLVMVHDDKRTVVYSRGTARPLKPTDVPPDIVRNARVLLVDGNQIEAQLSAAQTARAEGATVLYDAGTVRSGVERLVEQTDILIASRTFAEAYTRNNDSRHALECLYASGRHDAVVVTLGDEGYVGICTDGRFDAPAFDVRVVDTTGAGDVFHGAYASALTLSLRHEKCALFASACAALSCTKLGGRTGVPSRDEVEHFLCERLDLWP
jgi:sulfofructose kinase